MNKLTFYHHVGIVTPGALFLFGLMFYVPSLHDVFTKEGVSIGGFGIFVIISYAIGHLLAAFGNFIESIYWRLKGDMPSSWIVGRQPQLLSGSQIQRVQEQTASRLGLTLLLAETTPAAWSPVFRQIYSDV